MSGSKRTLYKYISLKYAVDAILQQRLYLSDGSSFNDPFDSSITNTLDGRVTKVEDVHILCLTNSYRNKLMWAHYAESHKGLCLTVRVPTEYIYPVCYSKTRVFSTSNVDEIFRKGEYVAKKDLARDLTVLPENKKPAYIKDRIWKYEKEYRAVFDNEDESSIVYENLNYYLPIKITNVYLGVGFDSNSSEIKESIISACKQQKIQITRMILDGDTYQLRVGHKN